MKITFNVPERTKGAVITLLVDEVRVTSMWTVTLDTDRLKDGAEFDLTQEQPKEGDRE